MVDALRIWYALQINQSLMAAYRPVLIVMVAQLVDTHFEQPSPESSPPSAVSTGALIKDGDERNDALPRTGAY